MGSSIVKHLKNQRGASVMISTLVIVALGLSGLQAADMSSHGTVFSSSEVQTKKAEGLAQAGVEKALSDLFNGNSPDNSYSVFGGTITTTTQPSQRLIVVKGSIANGDMADASRTYTLSGEFSGDTISIDPDQSYFVDNKMKNIIVNKTGDKTDIIDKIKVTWNEGNCHTDITCSNPTYHTPVDEDLVGADPYADFRDPNNSNKIIVCHHNNGNHGPNTISISENGWVNGHSGHEEDYLGECGGGGPSSVDATGQVSFGICDTDDISADQLSDLNACTDDDGNNEVISVTLDGQLVFDEGSVPDSDANALHSGDEGEIANFTFSNPGQIIIDEIEFDDDILDGTWVTLEIIFADGSSSYETFQMNQVGDDEDVVIDDDPNEQPISEPDVVAGDDFDEDGGEVIVSNKNDYLVTVEVLASEITCGAGGPEIGVDMKLGVNGSYSTLFSGQDVDGGENIQIPNMSVENAYSVQATASSAACNNYQATHASTNTLQVRSLLNGEQAPPLAGFGGQKPVGEVLAQYLDDQGRVVLDENQVIMLFELGVNMNYNPNSPAADFQDLVVLFTITKQETAN